MDNFALVVIVLEGVAAITVIIGVLCVKKLGRLPPARMSFDYGGLLPSYLKVHTKMHMVYLCCISLIFANLLVYYHHVDLSLFDELGLSLMVRSYGLGLYGGLFLILIYVTVCYIAITKRLNARKGKRGVIRDTRG